MIEIAGIKYITEKEASKIYGFSPSWFQKRRERKQPPPYTQLDGKGKVYYIREVLDKWFTEHLKKYY